MPSKKPPLSPLGGGWEDIVPTAPGRDMESARRLPIDLIDLNRQQARQHFDEARLEELRASVVEHGVLEPILVRPTVGDRYEIIAGERRFRASRLAGLTEIPVIIREDLDDSGVVLATATENLLREDLSMGDEARQYQRLLDILECSQRDLAGKLGIDRNRIARLIRLLQEAPALLNDIDAGRQTLRGALGSLGESSMLVAHSEPNSQAGSSVAHREPNSQAGSSDTDPQAGALPQRVHRSELLDGDGVPVEAAFKPTYRFARYVAALQPADVPLPQRMVLAEKLEVAARDAQLAARALRQAAAPNAQ